MTVRGLLLDRGCRDVVDNHAESFGGHVARLSYRVECTPPQNIARGGVWGPLVIRVLGHCWLPFGGQGVTIGWNVIHHRIARTGFGDC